MNEIDFTAALGRLLTDADLRARFRANRAAAAEQLGLRAEDRVPFTALEPAELEIQAQVLVRKRLEAVRRLLPQTCERLQRDLHRHFQDHAHAFWPKGSNREALDACAFAEHLAEAQFESLCRSELNRARFAASTARVRICFAGDVAVRGRMRAGWQIFFRGSRGRWWEWLVYFGW